VLEVFILVALTLLLELLIQAVVGVAHQMVRRGQQAVAVS
jgi:hypothetical protein